MTAENAEKQKETTPPPKKRHILRRICACFFSVLLLALFASSGFVWWATQTEGGHAWLEKTINGLLASPDDPDALTFKLANIAGSIPADFTFSVEAHDKNGLWLSAPDNRFAWNWRGLPGKFELSLIEAPRADLLRFPETAKKSEPSEPSKPLTIADIKDYLRTAAEFMGKEHWWLPEIIIQKVAATVLLPQEILPENGSRLSLNARASASAISNKVNLQALANLQNEDNTDIQAQGARFSQLDASASVSAGPDAEGIEAKSEIKASLNGLQTEMAAIPKGFIDEAPQVSLELAAFANTSADNPGVKINVSGPNLTAGHIDASGGGQWQTNAAWKQDEISGPLAYALNLTVKPWEEKTDSPLQALQAPASLDVKIAGDLPKISLETSLACARLVQSGIAITDTSLKIQSEPIDLPLNAGQLRGLENENHINLNLSSIIDDTPASLAATIFFQQLEDGDKKAWRAGMRDFVLNAAGATGTGSLAALLLPDNAPALDGNALIKIKQWEHIAKFLPGYKLSGDVSLAANLVSGLPKDLATPGQTPASAILPASLSIAQKADATLAIPAFLMADKKTRIELNQLNADIKAVDIFNKAAFNAQINAKKIRAADMALSADIQASGPLSGPISAKVSTQGSVNAKLAAQWQPGQARLDALDVMADLNALTGKKSGKKMLAGLRSEKPARIEYGDKGIQIYNLDVNIIPSGRLRANGGLSPNRIDLAVNLDKVEFKPWQALVPQIPGGSASLQANLQGTPAKPSGKFRLAVADITLPKSPVPPVSLALTGAIENAGSASVLKTRLEIDPKTVKALGGSTSQITANIPLLFGADGVPKPNMNGPIQAHVRWDGALGPIWSLVPIADRRVNGRVDINVTAGGTLAKPVLNGVAAIRNARYEDLLFGILLTDINVEAKLAGAGKPGKAKGPLDSLPGSIELAMNLSDGRGGSVTASGQGALDGSKLDIKTKINHLRPLRRRDIHIELSGNAQVSGSAAAPKIDGEIIVDKGEVLLNNLEMTGSVTTLKITDESQIKKAALQEPPKAESGGQINMRIRMLPRFVVEGRGLGSLWKANLNIVGPLDNPKVLGTIDCVRGNFDFLGKIFALTKGVVFFGGGSISDPLIDIDLTHETADLTAHILVTGPVNKIRIKLTSDPVVPRDEILSRVLFGRSVNDLSRMEMLQLAGAVAQLAGFGGGSSPLAMAKKALGVDVLRIGTSSAGEENLSGEDTGGGTTLEMGKYLNDYIYMGVQQGFKADSTAFIIEIELTPRTNMEVRTEQDNTWGGIKWKMNY